MTTRTLDQQLVKYLTDVHAIERQALVQMKVAPQLVDDPALKDAFTRHRAETEEHERLISQRLEAHGAKRSVTKDLAGVITGQGFGAFAAVQPDTPGKLLAHGLAYEHMEKAAYQLLARVAERAGDEVTVQTARTIEGQEQAMAERIEQLLDQAVDASLGGLAPDDLGTQLNKYLADAHAIEVQAIALLQKSPKLAGDSELAEAYRTHLEETENHRRLIDERLAARDSSPSKLKDLALKAGALNWGAFFAAQPDTPAKLAAFAYAFEHLEIAAYELLSRVAQQAGDPGTVAVAVQILAQERAAAEKLNALFDRALDASLGEQDLALR
jgi:ferritin-like metal-binding protein YciE